MTPYAVVLGAALDGLPPACRALHTGFGTWHGRITVTPARFVLLRLVARAMGLPAAVEDAPFTLVTKAAGPGTGARWTRIIGADRVASRLDAAADNTLIEHLGPARVSSRLVPEADGLRLETQSVSMLGLSLPRVSWPTIRAREWQQDGLYCFDISVDLPVLGARLVAYRGALDTLNTGL